MQRFRAFVLLTGVLLAALPAGAQIPDVSPPECVPVPGIPCPGSGDDGSGTYDDGGSDTYVAPPRPAPGPTPAQQAAAARAVRLAAAYQNNQAGVAAFNLGNFAEAGRLFQLAVKGNPNDAVMRQNLENAKEALANAQAKAKAAAERKQAEAAYNKKMQALAALMPPLSPMPAGQNTLAPVPPPPPGMAATTWQAYRDAQGTVDRLYARLNKDGVLSDADAQAFYAALRQRNAIWDAARAGPPLNSDQRETLALPLPLALDPALRAGTGAKCSLASLASCIAPSPKPAAAPSRAEATITAFVSDYAADPATGVIEDQVGQAIETAAGEAPRSGYESLLAVAKIAVGAAEGGASAVGAAITDLVIARLPGPLGLQAQLAETGGRHYANVACEALYRVIETSNAAVGGHVDAQAWIRNFAESLTPGQRGVQQWGEVCK